MTLRATRVRGAIGTPDGFSVMLDLDREPTGVEATLIERYFNGDIRDIGVVVDESRVQVSAENPDDVIHSVDHLLRQGLAAIEEQRAAIEAAIDRLIDRSDQLIAELSGDS